MSEDAEIKRLEEEIEHYARLTCEIKMRLEQLEQTLNPYFELLPREQFRPWAEAKRAIASGKAQEVKVEVPPVESLRVVNARDAEIIF